MRSTFAIRISFVFLAIATASVSPAAPPVVTFQAPDYVAFINYAHNNVGYKLDWFEPRDAASLPISETLSISNPEVFPPNTSPLPVPKSSYSNATVDWSAIGDQYVLTIDMEHRRDGQLGFSFSPHARTNVELMFSVDRDTPYEMSGYYKVTDDDPASYGWVSMHVELSSFEHGQGTKYDFVNDQHSEATHNERFELHTKGGDWSSGIQWPGQDGPVGSTTGILRKGVIYELPVYFGIALPNGAVGSTPPGATAIGNFTFKIGEATVPEPSTLFMLLPVAAVLMRRRR